MGSWGATTTDESKPKYLTDEEKRDCYATDRGWTVPAGGNPDGEREVLVAIGGLSGGASTTAALAHATISSINWNISSYSRADGGTLSVTVNFNEAVDVVTTGGTPTLEVINDSRDNHTLSYASGTGTNRLVFTLVIGAGGAALQAGNVISIGANAITLNDGTVKDKGTEVVSTITNSAAIGTAAGTITAAA